MVKDKGGLLWDIVIGLLGGFVGGLRIQAARWKNFRFALITIGYA